MNKEEMLNAVVDVLQEMDEDEFISINNRIFDEEDDNHIFSRDEFDEVFDMRSPSEIAGMVQDSSMFDVNDWYFTKSIYDDLCSDDSPQNLVDIEEIAEFVVDNRTGFDVDELEELLKKYDA